MLIMIKHFFEIWCFSPMSPMLQVDSLPTEPWGEDWIPRGYFFLFRELSFFLLFPTHSVCWKCNLSNSSVLIWKSLFQSPYSPAPVFTRLNLNQSPYFFMSSKCPLDMNLSKLQETVQDKGALRAAVHGIPKSQKQLSDWTTSTKPPKKWQVECSYLWTHNLSQVFLGS